MAQPPPLAVRTFVLLAAVALLATAVCTKTEKAADPASENPATLPADPPPPAEVEAVEAPAADAAPPPPTAIQELPPPPAPNPPANAADGRKNNSNKKPDKVDKEFFPATKSGGMF